MKKEERLSNTKEQNKASSINNNNDNRDTINCVKLKYTKRCSIYFEIGYDEMSGEQKSRMRDANAIIIMMITTIIMQTLVRSIIDYSEHNLSFNDNSKKW